MYHVCTQRRARKPGEQVCRANGCHEPPPMTEGSAREAAGDDPMHHQHGSSLAVVLGVRVQRLTQAQAFRTPSEMVDSPWPGMLCIRAARHWPEIRGLPKRVKWGPTAGHLERRRAAVRTTTQRLSPAACKTTVHVQIAGTL